MPFSHRAISAPPSRPDSWSLTPFAPPSIARCMACFIVRRKLARFSSCSAMSSAMSWASISGRVTSTVFTSMCRRVSFSSAFVSLSIFSPFLPMIAPTRLLVTTTVTRSRVRSMRMSAIPGRCCLRSRLSVRNFWMNARMATSSSRSSA